ncbi:MAG: divalent-cation tolerance protein CutA [Pseudomonadota bacterium]
MQMNPCSMVVSTVPSAEKAAEIARIVVDEGLAACVNIVPAVRSIYRWKGATCDETEALCLIKTTRSRADALRQRLVELHPYEVPEILVLDIAGGHAAYLAWVRECCG